MKKIISFSLYGSHHKYSIGAMHNAKLANWLFPDWTCRFYVGIGVSKEVKSNLRRAGSEVVEIYGEENPSAMFWRFRPIAEEPEAIVIVRDSDSRLSEREAVAVADWIESRKALHVIRDHPMHNAPILGGLWGVRTEYLPNFHEDLERYTPVGYYGEDQEFLTKFVYKKCSHSRLIHDSFFRRNIHSSELRGVREQYSYLGESFDENGNYDIALRLLIKKYHTSKTYQVVTKLRGLARLVVGK